MTRYYPGVNEALAKVDTMTELDCIQSMHGLQGIDNLRYGASLEDVRDELRRQIREDFTDRSRPDEDAYIKTMAEIARRR